MTELAKAPSAPSLDKGAGAPDRLTIAATGLSRWYGQVIALNDVTVGLRPGVTGLLGPNGAGKTTFLRLVVGLVRPTGGDVKVLGQDPFSAVEGRRQLGYCPEHDHFYEDMTGLEFVTLMTRLLGFSAADAKKRAEIALERVRLGGDDARRKPVSQYSKGMRQKTKIAQALAHEPDIIVLDEPLTGADPVSRHEISELTKELGRLGHTVVVSSHILHEVERVTQNFVLIDRGRLLAEGNVTEIRNLIDKHPHRILIVCDRPRELAASLAHIEDITGLDLPGDDTLTVLTRRPDACYDAIARMAVERGIVIRKLTSPDNNLDAVFRYLTRR
ncbi:MAG: ABC transporter ATP-binding protein [Myxococcales bacterium]|nr:ABC transporter ATP-binding protein [Myxococcales bacterium]